MRSYEILDRKDFTSMLFIGSVFDEFRLVSAQFTTFAEFSIDGHRYAGFYDSEEKNRISSLQEELVLWKEIRPHAFNLIRGKKPPLRFQIVLQLPENSNVITLPESLFRQVPGTRFYLNIHYRNQVLTCTSGVSMSGFYPGFRPDPVWDQAVERFFADRSLAVQDPVSGAGGS